MLSKHQHNCALSGPIFRDTAILSLRYPISRDTFSGRLGLPKNGAIPPWHLVSHRRVCAIPHFATYRAIIARYPTKKTRNSFAILSLQLSRDMKSIATGPLRLRDPPPPKGRYSAIPYDTLKNVDAIGIAIPYSVATPPALQSPEAGNPENAIFETKKWTFGRSPWDPFK